ncbi:MAG: hypothetical protein ACREV3_01535 [Gammaproteobacteria bacterium]
MRRLAVKVSGALLIMGLIAPNAFAHGGVSIEADKCVLKIGEYLMHFTGYQPENSGGEEFCEDIPSTGHAIIVMDFVDSQLRRMDADLRIVKTDTWSAAQAYKQGDEAEEVLYIPPKKYNGGSITVDQRFAEPGYFVGIVTAKGHEEIASVFPFSVGYGIGAFSGGSGGRNLTLAIGALFAILVSGALYWYTSRKKQVAVAPRTA